MLPIYFVSLKGHPFMPHTNDLLVTVFNRNRMALAATNSYFLSRDFSASVLVKLWYLAVEEWGQGVRAEGMVVQGL